jgi:hypothetical protein
MFSTLWHFPMKFFDSSTKEAFCSTKSTLSKNRRSRCFVILPIPAPQSKARPWPGGFCNYINVQNYVNMINMIFTLLRIFCNVIKKIKDTIFLNNGRKRKHEWMKNIHAQMLL